MRLVVTVYILCIFHSAYSVLTENIQLSVYHHDADELLLKSITKISKRINADNRLLNVITSNHNCAQENEKLCSEPEKNELVLVISTENLNVNHVAMLDQTAVKESEVIVQRAFADFFTKIFIKQAESVEALKNKDEIAKLWNDFEETKLSKNSKELQLKSDDDLKALIDKHKDDKVYFVLYYTRDNLENLMLLTYSLKMSSASKRKLAIVNCEVTPNICKSSTPVLASYKDIDEYQTYDGKLDYSSISDWSQKLANPVLSVLNSDVVPMYRSGIVPGFENVQDTVHMLFASSKKHKIYKDYLDFAKKTHGKYHLTAVVEDGIAQWPNQPAFITMKPLETISKAFVMFKDITYDSMVNYISTSIHPSVHDLSSADALLTALSLERPLTIFFDYNNLKEDKQFATLASEHPIRQNTTEFARIKGANVFGKYFLDNIDKKSFKSSYILLNKDRTCVYTKPIAKENRDEILHWITSSLNKPCEREIRLNIEEIINLSQWDRYLMLKDVLKEEIKQAHDEL